MIIILLGMEEISSNHTILFKFTFTLSGKTILQISYGITKIAN